MTLVDGSQVTGFRDSPVLPAVIHAPRAASIRQVAPSLLVAVAIAIAGCGGDQGLDESTISVRTAAPAKLTPEEVALIRRTERAVTDYCRGVAEALARGQSPSAESFQRVTGALEGLAALARAKPEAPAPGGSSPRLALGDIAEDLEGTNCDSRLVRRIDQALATIP